MKTYVITTETTLRRTYNIQASSEEEATKFFLNKDFDFLFEDMDGEEIVKIEEDV